MSPIFYAIPVFAALIALEMGLAHRQGLRVYRFQDTLTSLNIGVLSQFVNTLGSALGLGIYALISTHWGAFTWDVSHPLTWLTALLLYDFCYYWLHRLNHEVNILWAAHVVHHSSEEFNLSTALRQSSTGFLSSWIFYVPMALLGIPLKVFVIVGLIDLVYQFWVHTRLVGRLGWLEWVLVTPSNHRVHHGQNDYCIDRNYGGLLIVWDRMFGTFADEREDDKPVYGIRKPLRSWNPVWANLHHYADLFRQVAHTPGWQGKLRCLFASPGSPAPGVTAPPSFEPSAFQRFVTPAPLWMAWLGMACTLAGSAWLMHFLWFQSQWPVWLRAADACAVLLFYLGLGWLWLHPRVTGQSKQA
jgi:alkylglycerol monooxygenase